MRVQVSSDQCERAVRRVLAVNGASFDTSIQNDCYVFDIQSDESLLQHDIDIAIMVTPLNKTQLIECMMDRLETIVNALTYDDLDKPATDLDEHMAPRDIISDEVDFLKAYIKDLENL